MLVNVDITVCGYGVNTEIEIEEWEVAGMNEKEKDEYIHQQAFEYVKENLEVGCEIIKE